MQKVKEKSNWKGETIVEIEIERLKAFRNHPFQVRDDDDLEKLKESIKMYGILTPLLVRPIKDGTYEIISGHRRKRAAALLGYRKIPVLIQPMSYEDAVVKMVDTNLHVQLVVKHQMVLYLLVLIRHINISIFQRCRN